MMDASTPAGDASKAEAATGHGKRHGTEAGSGWVVAPRPDTVGHKVRHGTTSSLPQPTTWT